MRQKKPLKHIVLLVIVSVSLYVSCSRDQSTAIDRTETLASSRGEIASKANVEGLDPHAALALANKWKATEPGVTSFVNTELISFEFANGDKASIPLPEPKMVVAIAPYITYTHPCTIHYTSGCQGELANKTMKVFGKTADGLVVVDTTVTTLENGFFELWLGRDLDIELSVEYDGRRSVQRITTYNSSNTCITTMHLL